MCHPPSLLREGGFFSLLYDLKGFCMRVFSQSLCAGLVALCAASAAHAGGVALGATRVIYPENQKQTSLPLTNSSDSMRFLIQSWVSDANGNNAANFIVTPPLFVLGPKKENKLRIIYNGPMLPQDRESVFYVNTKAIPSVPKDSLQGNTLQIATQSVIKLFMRPDGLPSRSVDAPKSLTCHLSAGHLTVTNPSPYYVTLVQFTVGGRKMDNNMVPPKSTLNVDVPGNAGGAVRFSTVNDYGANTPEQTCTG